MFDTSAVSLTALNPWKLAADTIVNAVRGAYATIRNFGKNMVAFHVENKKAAEDVGATALEYARLSNAAERAGVHAEDVADAIERSKNGESTLEEIAEQWERIAEGTSKNASNISNVARLCSYMETHETKEMNLVQYLVANLSGDYQAGQALGNLMKQVNNGRRQYVFWKVSARQPWRRVRKSPSLRLYLGTQRLWNGALQGFNPRFGRASFHDSITHLWSCE